MTNSKTRPPRAHKVQLEKNLVEWTHELHKASLDCGCETLLLYAVRELYRATNSRSARKAIELNYVLNDAQWNRITTEYADYIRNHGVRPKLSIRQLGLLDTLQDSRLARVFLRALGPAPPWWWRAVQREHIAMQADTFGIKNPGTSEGREYREYRHARRTERVKNVRDALLRRYRQCCHLSILISLNR